MPDSLKVLQIVRRYGPVGGMERYVWELSRALADAGCQIAILCESVHGEAHPGIAVHEIGRIRPKPRWLSAMRFSARVSRWLAEHPQPGWILHSHETTGVHHVTTFHGPPFAHVRSKTWWKKLSLRIHANLWLEQREVCGKQVQAVVPNSGLIGERLATFHPCIGDRMTAPVPPGVEPFPPRLPRQVPSDGGIIGFVGKEWKRKGLDTALRIVAELRQSRPNISIRVAGPQPSDIWNLFSQWPHGYELLGPTNVEEFYQDIDLLLHPARMEPFGMVITEAMSAGVPVLISDQCGAKSEVPPDQVLSLEDSSAIWAEAADRLLGESPEPYRRSWQQVAVEQMEIYQGIARV